MGSVFNQPKERETEAGDEGSFSRELILKPRLESRVELAGQQKGLAGPAAEGGDRTASPRTTTDTSA